MHQPNSSTATWVKKHGFSYELSVMWWAEKSELAPLQWRQFVDFILTS
jgi:hypothetical protein